MFICHVEELKPFTLKFICLTDMKTCLMLFLALLSITINDETEVLNVQEMSADLCNQIPENLKEAK